MNQTMTHDDFFVAHPEWRGHGDLVLRPPSKEEILEEFDDAIGEIACECDALTQYGVTRGALYLRLRREGQSHRFAEMIAFQAGPSLRTDVSLFKGVGTVGTQFNEDHPRGKKLLDFYVGQAKKHGHTPQITDMYQPGLARFPGDPEAWVPASGGRGYIKRLCEKRGWGCEGMVDVKAREPDGDPWAVKKSLAEDIVTDKMSQAIEKNPNLAKGDRRELRRQVLRRYGARPDQ